MASELQVNTITEATSGSGITFAKDVIPATPLSHRNIIINGGMNVYQRGSLSITQSNNGGYALDRFQFTQSGSIGQWEGTMTQDTTMSDADIATTGQRNALKILTTTVENSISADEESRLMYKIEAQDCQRLRYGTSSAQSATLSFWAKSTVAGDYAVSIWQTDGSDVIGSKYTLAANTWTKVSITFAGNTLENIANDNTEGLRINFMLIAGGDYTSADNTSWGGYTATKLAYGHTASSVSNPWGTNANDAWYITGIQFELGSVATPFEHRSYMEELQRCRRYYYVIKCDTFTWPMSRYSLNSGGGYYGIPLPVEMNHDPDLSTTGTWNSGSGYAGTPSLSRSDPSAITISSGVSVTQNGTLFLEVSSGTGSLRLDSEL